MFRETLATIEALGGEPIEIDLQPFLETARLLYQGPWVAERFAAIRSFLEHKANTLYPVTREIVGSGKA